MLFNLLLLLEYMLVIQSVSDYTNSKPCLDADYNSEIDRPYTGINLKGDISYLRARNTYWLAVHITMFSHGITPCFVFCPLYFSTGWVMNIYRCLIKVIFVWVVIPNGWEPSRTKAARTTPLVTQTPPPRTLLSPSGISALPSLSHIQHFFLPDAGCYF